MSVVLFHFRKSFPLLIRKWVLALRRIVKLKRGWHRFDLRCSTCYLMDRVHLRGMGEIAIVEVKRGGCVVVEVTDRHRNVAI